MVSVLDAREDIPFQSDDGWEKTNKTKTWAWRKKTGV